MTTKREHYVPRFLICRFSCGKDALVYVCKENKIIRTNPETLFSNKYLYEVKNKDGSIFEVNAVESAFSVKEAQFCNALRLVIDEGNEPSETEREIIAEAFALQLMRPKELKDLFIDNPLYGVIPEEDVELVRNAMYISMIAPKGFVTRYLRFNGWTHSTSVFEEPGANGFISFVSHLILETCDFALIETSGGAEFVLAEKPIAIGPVNGYQYIFPVDPSHALGAKKRESISLPVGFNRVLFTAGEVEEVNSVLVGQVKGNILCSCSYQVGLEALVGVSQE